MSFDLCCLSPKVSSYSIAHNPRPIHLPSDILEIIEKLLWYAPNIKSIQSISNPFIDDTTWALARFHEILIQMGINVKNDVIIGYPSSIQTNYYSSQICTSCQKIIYTCQTNETYLKAFLRHSRNAIAHGRFQLVGNFIILFDYNDAGNNAIIKVDINKLYKALGGIL